MYTQPKSNSKTILISKWYSLQNLLRPTRTPDHSYISDGRSLNDLMSKSIDICIVNLLTITVHDQLPLNSQKGKKIKTHPNGQLKNLHIQLQIERLFKSNQFHRQPKRTICWFGLQRSFGRNIRELLVYYLMSNKCKKS